MFPDAQAILDTLEYNRDWYQNKIPASRTTSASSEDVIKTEESEQDKPKFQFTTEQSDDSSEDTGM